MFGRTPGGKSPGTLTSGTKTSGTTTPGATTPGASVAPSRVDEVRALSLPKKPHTRGLLLWAALHVDQAEADYRAHFDGAPPRTQDLLDRIDSSIVVFTTHFTDVALGRLGRKTVFLPNAPLPREAKAIFAFSGALAEQLAALLQAEGFTSNIDALLRRAIRYKMLLHADPQIDEQHRLAAKILADLRTHEAANVRQWHNATQRIVENTLRLQTATDAERAKHDLPKLYSSQLAALLKTVR